MQLAGILSANTCGVKIGKTCRGSVVTSSVVKAAGVLCTASHWESWSLLLCGWYQYSLLFFLVPSHLDSLNFASLCVEWNQSGSFAWCLERLGKLLVHPACSFPARRNLSSWGVPSWLWAVPAWGMRWYRQNEVIFLPLFVGLFSVLFCCCCSCWNFLSGLLSCPRAVSVCG